MKRKDWAIFLGSLTVSFAAKLVAARTLRHAITRMAEARVNQSTTS